MAKIQQGKATSEDLFKALDTENTGQITKSEFTILSKRLGMNLSDHRINEIFASVKQGESDASTTDTLNEAQFAKA